MQKARRRRRRFGPVAVGMWSSRAQTATHHPLQNMSSSNLTSSPDESVNDGIVTIAVLRCPVLVSADGHFVLGEYSHGEYTMIST